MNAIRKNETPKKTATPVMSWMKWWISFAIGVSPVSRPDAKPAIRPITVLSPQEITTPFAVPETTKLSPNKKRKSHKQTFNSVSREECQVFRFQWVFMCKLDASRLRLGFTSQWRIINFKASAFGQANISRDPVAEFDHYKVSDYKFFSTDG